jgi:predicted thioesterase
MDRLTPGLAAEIETIVTEDNTAERLGSGSVPVFGTPALVQLMEGAAIRVLEGLLPPGTTSVGSRLDVRHLAPTPVGMHVRARAELLEVEGRRLAFRVEAWDERQQIGEAMHERFVVDRERFIDKATVKS